MIKKKINYFLLLVLAFLFQISTRENINIDKTKTTSFYENESKESKNEKIFYSFIFEFQQKTKDFGFKKINNFEGYKGVFFELPENTLPLFFACKNSINLKKISNVFFKSLNYTFKNFIGEKMYKSRYLV